HHNLCPDSQGTIVGRYGGFADRLRVQWLWARPLPDSLDIAKAGPLLCDGVTVFSPLLQHNLPPTARVVRRRKRRCVRSSGAGLLTSRIAVFTFPFYNCAWSSLSSAGGPSSCIFRSVSVMSSTAFQTSTLT